MALRNSKKIKNCSCGCVKGKVRDNNEDNFYFAGQYLEPDSEGLEASISESIDLMKDDKRGHLFAVFDGMGGGQHGEIASYEAAKCLSEYIQRYEESGVTLDVFMLETLCKKLNERVYAAGVQKGASVMGTTIAAMYFRDDKQWSCNVGDSRCYSYHPAQGLKPLTHDHSLVQEMVDNGEITPEEAFCHPDGNIITRGLGDFGSEVNPDFVVHPVKGNETLMLCSDGLCGYCVDKDLEACMDKNYTDTANCCNSLLQQALDVGGYHCDISDIYLLISVYISICKTITIKCFYTLLFTVEIYKECC